MTDDCDRLLHAIGDSMEKFTIKQLKEIREAVDSELFDRYAD